MNLPPIDDDHIIAVFAVVALSMLFMILMEGIT